MISLFRARRLRVGFYWKVVKVPKNRLLRLEQEIFAVRRHSDGH